MQVVPSQSLLEAAGDDIDVILPPHSLTSFDFLKETSSIKMARTDSLSLSSM